MKNPLIAVKDWTVHAFLVLRSFEEAIEYRPEDQALDRIKRLEQRVASLEGRRAPIETSAPVNH